MFDKLIAVLPENGDEITFEAFMSAARVAGARADLWLRAKHAKLLETRIDENGVLQARRVVAQPVQPA